MITPFNSQIGRGFGLPAVGKRARRKRSQKCTRQFRRKSGGRMPFGGEITGCLGGAKQGRQSPKQSLDFVGVQNRRFHLQSRASQRNERKVRLDRPLQLIGSREGTCNFCLFGVSLCSIIELALIELAVSRLLVYPLRRRVRMARVVGFGDRSRLCIFGGSIRCHLASLQLLGASETRLLIVRSEHYPNDEVGSNTIFRNNVQILPIVHLVALPARGEAIFAIETADPADVG
jgi:hypothetical protein